MALIKSILLYNIYRNNYILNALEIFILFLTTPNLLNYSNNNSKYIQSFLFSIFKVIIKVSNLIL